jgi:hypothetical protein
MPMEKYGEYYRREYREQLARFKGKPPVDKDYQDAFASSTRHGEALALCFARDWREGLTIEVGSSVGGVLNGVRRVVGGEVIGIEPSPGEAGEANRRGITTHVALFEAFDGRLPPAANILCTQSLNHLLDPRRFLLWAHQNLAEGGRLVLEVMNFRHVFRHYGWIQRAIQIDHTYMFVPEVLEAFVQGAGFKLLRMDIDERKSRDELKASSRSGLPALHVRLIAAKSDAAPLASGSAAPHLFLSVRDSLASLPNSGLRYFLRFELKRGIKRRLRRLKGKP